MSKNFVNDIVKRKSLKEILPGRNTTVANLRKSSSSVESGEAPLLITKRSRAPFILMWLIVMALIVFLFIIFSTVFARATIDVLPKQGRVLLENEEFVAKTQVSTGELEFGLTTVEIVESATATATGRREVKRKASGQITIFNNFSEEAQELIANTRFESPEGNIYRIDKAVMVPGVKTVEGKSVPGQLEVTVYADEEGAEYNIGLVDFTIPGFAGSPRFAGFFARSKTPMTGGLVGQIKTVTEEEEERIRTELRQKLQSKNKDNQLKALEGFIMPAGGVFTALESVPIVQTAETDSDKVKIEEKLIVTGVLFDKQKLGTFIASRFIPEYTGESVDIVNLEEIDFTINNKEDLEPVDLNQIDVTLNGNAHIVWTVDVEILKDSVRGLKSGDFANIISRFPAIESVIPKFRPPWIRTVPDNVDKIKVHITVLK